jgi:hypothetical protein
MKVRRVSSTRPPDHTSNTWNVASPNSLIPGDILSGAPGFGGQSLREASGPVIMEEHMAVHEAPAPSEKPARTKKTRIRAVLPREASRIISASAMDAPDRTAFNIRLPTKLLNRYKSMGRGTSARIIAVLELFIAEGGTFTEE